MPVHENNVKESLPGNANDIIGLALQLPRRLSSIPLCVPLLSLEQIRCERDCIRQRRSRNNQIQNDVSLDPFDDTVLAPLRIPYVPLHQVEGVCARCAREVCYPICLIDLFVHLSVSLYAEKRSLL
jgi:hypothetical protein